MASQELHEALPELETEAELEGAAPLWRGAYPQGEAEAETEAFFESLAEYAVGRGGRGGGGLGRIAGAAASAARTAGVPLAQMGISTNGDAIIEGELESALAGQGMHPAALMEHYGHAAAEAESEAEAEAFLFPLIPLAAKLLAPQIGRLVMRRAPQLIRGVTRASRILRRNPRTRPLVRVMPTVVRRTVADIGRQTAQRGRPVTPQAASAALARQTQAVLGNPRQCVHAYRRSRRLDRRYHVTVREVR
jgi:pyruvate/2-oxoglutarate dehydrogenase complex dihydrolipoamide acyltransferase (E2) component